MLSPMRHSRSRDDALSLSLSPMLPGEEDAVGTRGESCARTPSTAATADLSASVAASPPACSGTPPQPVVRTANAEAREGQPDRELRSAQPRVRRSDVENVDMEQESALVAAVSRPKYAQGTMSIRHYFKRKPKKKQSATPKSPVPTPVSKPSCTSPTLEEILAECATPKGEKTTTAVSKRKSAHNDDDGRARKRQRTNASANSAAATKAAASDVLSLSPLEGHHFPVPAGEPAEAPRSPTLSEILAECEASVRAAQN